MRVLMISKACIAGAYQRKLEEIAGAAIFTWLRDEVARRTEFWRAVMGGVILVIVLLFPQGIVGGLKALKFMSAYGAAKAGVQAMMRVLSREGARRGIRANSIAPGVVDTAMAATIPEPVRAEMLRSVPLGRFGRPEEIAAVALFLCSPLASYVTGQTIEVNGGWRG